MISKNGAKKKWDSDSANRVGILQRAGITRKWKMWQSYPWKSLPKAMQEDLARLMK